MNKLLTILFLSVAAVTARAQSWNSPGAANPFIPGYFADPTIRKFGDTYYLYATTDGTGNGYGPAQVWVSKDFRNWRNIVMNWPTTEVVWAPDVVQQPDGSFRYYYCRPCEVLVGESQSPVGPWRNILGADDAVLVPDRFVHNAITLDPQLFRDDDGQEYLYFCTWGTYKGFGCGVAKVNGSQLGEKRLIPNTELKDIFEAPFVFKHADTYYFTYSSGSCHDHTYRVQYATSKTGPMGPFEYKGCLLETNADQTVHGPGHHSILEEDGRYYIVYHRHNLPRSVHGFNRQVCIDELTFDEKGNILPVKPTHSGSSFFTLHSIPERSSPTRSLSLSTSKNLAFGAKVTASSYYDDWFKPEYAVDDNNATLWKASGTNWASGRHQDEWLLIDLGRVQKFSEVWTQFEYATFFYQYKIETSADGTQWTLFADRTANTMQGSPMIDKANSCVSSVASDQRSSASLFTHHSSLCKARYLRITITDTQKNGHAPAIWNVKVWQKAPSLPDVSVEAYDGYPGMHRKDVETSERTGSTLSFDVSQLAQGRTKPFDVTEITVQGDLQSPFPLQSNKPLHARIKDGRWALFFNGSQSLSTATPLPKEYCYNSPYTISAWLLQTEGGAMQAVASLSASRADLATTELRLGSDPQAGLVNHNGSFESCGAPDVVGAAVGGWHHWLLTFDGWMERVYLDGCLVHEQNNFLMVRPEGQITIGADATGANFFRGYISSLSISPKATSKEEVGRIYAATKDSQLPSLGDDDFDESDPDSRFSLSPAMTAVGGVPTDYRLSATTADFNAAPLSNGAQVVKELTGDFVVMARISDMEGLADRAVKGYNETGLFISEEVKVNSEALDLWSLATEGTQEFASPRYYQLGAFPLYNCGNMLTILSPAGRPQFPNYKGYDFDPLLQFERRGNQLFARTSRDGQKWQNMPGSPIELSAPTVGVGLYQTTYSDNRSWATLTDFIIYQ